MGFQQFKTLAMQYFVFKKSELSTCILKSLIIRAFSFTKRNYRTCDFKYAFTYLVYNLLWMRVHNWGLGKDLLIRMEEVHQHSSLLC